MVSKAEFDVELKLPFVVVDVVEVELTIFTLKAASEFWDAANTYFCVGSIAIETPLVKVAVCVMAVRVPSLAML